MKVGILGTGDVGRALADGFLSRGHDVLMGSRSADNPKLAEWLAGAKGNASGGTFEDAAKHGEVVVLASLGMVNPEVIKAAGPKNLAGKVVIDATNPLDFSQGFPPRMPAIPEGSAGAQVQALAPDASVVKAFNTVGNPYMVDPDMPGGPPTMFIAGNDAEAKAKVTRILADFGWPDTLDVGDITASHYLEAMTMVWVAAFAARGNGDHAFKLIHK
ncbi:MAG: NAD(P)-binding domain-containing protein [Euryarchaeota archaeon]|nr:NAD(P)-binding domain-containing protein [Euryarchaeota archaeon]